MPASVFGHNLGNQEPCESSSGVCPSRSQSRRVQPVRAGRAALQAGAWTGRCVCGAGRHHCSRWALRDQAGLPRGGAGFRLGRPHMQGRRDPCCLPPTPVLCVKLGVTWARAPTSQPPCGWGWGWGRVWGPLRCCQVSAERAAGGLQEAFSPRRLSTGDLWWPAAPLVAAPRTGCFSSRGDLRSWPARRWGQGCCPWCRALVKRGSAAARWGRPDHRVCYPEGGRAAPLGWLSSHGAGSSSCV